MPLDDLGRSEREKSVRVVAATCPLNDDCNAERTESIHMEAAGLPLGDDYGGELLDTDDEESTVHHDGSGQIGCLPKTSMAGVHPAGRPGRTLVGQGKSDDDGVRTVCHLSVVCAGVMFTYASALYM
eukprot:gene35606-64920_t